MKVARRKSHQVDLETRVNKDKRTSRKEHSKVFKTVIKYYRRKHPLKDRSPVSRLDELTTDRFSVFVRKRPIFEHEIKKGEYDIVSCYPRKRTIVVHDCRMRSDLKITNGYVDNQEFHGFDGIFNERTKNDEVYRDSIMVLLQHVLSGKLGTVFMLGQTGSGKTYTINGITKLLSDDLFHWAQFMPNIQIRFSCFEMSGDTVNDLLNRRKKLIIREDSTGCSRLIGIREEQCLSSDDLLKKIDLAMSRRATKGTAVNSVSSRSHCFLRITLDVCNSQTGEKRNFGQMTLVDLAGSERNSDSMFHSAERRAECSKINSSLMALKDCMRVYRRNQMNGTSERVPYRANKLTLVLKECFMNKKHRTVICATCSPNPTDTEHTINTLRHVCPMGKNYKINQKPLDVKKVLDRSPLLQERRLPVPPRKWTVVQVKEWVGNVGNGKFRNYVTNFSTQCNGKQLIRYSKKRFTQICGGRAKYGRALRNLLVKEIQRTNRAKENRVKSNRDLMHGNRGRFF